MAMLHSLIARRRFGPQAQWRPLRKTLTSGLGAWRYVFGLARRGSTIGFHLLWHTVELAMSTRLCLLQWLIWFLCFRFDALTELGAFMRTEFLCVSVLRVASGPSFCVFLCRGPGWGWLAVGVLWITVKTAPSQNGPKSERPPFGQNGLINWLKRPHIPNMKVKTAPSQNGPFFFFFFL